MIITVLDRVLLLFSVFMKGLIQTCIDFELKTEASLFSLKIVVVCPRQVRLGASTVLFAYAVACVLWQDQKRNMSVSLV
jgi:hypothetical protein